MKISKIRDVITPKRGGGTLEDRSGGIDFFIPKFNEKFIEDLKSKNEFFQILDNKFIKLDPQNSILIPSGIKVNLNTVAGFNKTQHNGIIMKCDNKSGVSTKKGLIIGATIIDEDYQGELHIHVINTTKNTVYLEEDFKLAQMLLIPIFIDNEIDVVDESELFTEQSIRGAGCFGSTNKKVIIIAGLSSNWAIGKDNDLVIKDKDDMKHFRETTTGNSIVMGYNTYVSIGSKPLKDRMNYVVTSNSNNIVDSDNLKFISHSEMLDMVYNKSFEHDKLFVIGGEQLYNSFIDNHIWDEAIITVFEEHVDDADKFFDLGIIKANSDKITTTTINKKYKIYKFIK